MTVLAGSGQPLEPCGELDPISVSWQRCQLLFQVITVDQECDGNIRALRAFLGPAEPRGLFACAAPGNSVNLKQNSHFGHCLLSEAVTETVRAKENLL